MKGHRYRLMSRPRVAGHQLGAFISWTDPQWVHAKRMDIGLARVFFPWWYHKATRGGRKDTQDSQLAPVELDLLAGVQ